ncbi:hypothetical protein [Aliiroseovarius sp. S253]|uniref:hypothetical protein n=1 Tax=Aliiroseovarius sp. S253 TaxID=3415133 RepID=UPI003C79FBCE
MRSAAYIRPQCTLLGLAAFVALASPIKAETVPTEPEMVFEIICDFDKFITDDTAIPKERNNVRVFASTSTPELIERNSTSTFEIHSSDGTRHFINPSIGGPSSGSFTTIYKDGTGIRVNQSEFQDGFHVVVEIGKCEVKEQ